jgi:phosphatidylglycerophosphatase A
VAFRLKKGQPAGPPDGWVLLAAWGPCGYAPVAPGTFGTLGAVPLWWALSKGGPAVVLAATVLLFAIAVPAAARAGRYWQVVDASPIVIDEVVGYLVAVAGFPFSWRVAIAAFVLFRFFDVLKPWPASAFDRIKSGFGVVMDDVAAGVWSLAALHLGMWALRALS